MKRLFFVVVWILGASFQPAELLANGSATSLVATLSVSAMGTIDLQPDMAHVSLAVETAGKTFEHVQFENQQKMQRVIDALVKLGIEKKQIQTTSFNVTPQYAPRPPRDHRELPSTRPPEIIGYTARNTIMVEIQELEMVGKVVDRSLSVGANRFSGIQWMLRDRHPVYLKAINLASRKALEKAKVLANALNVSLVRLQSVQEGPEYGQPPRKSYAMSRMALAESSGDSVPLSPGEIQVQATVSLVYHIEPQSNE